VERTHCYIYNEKTSAIVDLCSHKAKKNVHEGELYVLNVPFPLYNMGYIFKSKGHFHKSPPLLEENMVYSNVWNKIKHNWIKGLGLLYFEVWNKMQHNRITYCIGRFMVFNATFNNILGI